MGEWFVGLPRGVLPVIAQRYFTSVAPTLPFSLHMGRASAAALSGLSGGGRDWNTRQGIAAKRCHAKAV